MPVPGGGFDQAYNAQAAVDTGSMLVVALGVTQACNDKEQVAPMLDQLAALPTSLGQPKELVADTGFYSARNVEACAVRGIDPFIAVKRDFSHLPVAPAYRFLAPHYVRFGALGASQDSCRLIHAANRVSLRTAAPGINHADRAFAPFGQTPASLRS